MIPQVVAYIEANKDAFASRMNDFLRIPCISTDASRTGDMHRAATWVHELLSGIGFTSQIVETPGHPAVLADSGPADGGATLLVYGHYDVQPVGDESLWDAPAFEPTVRDGIVYARGAADDKGQLLTHLFAAESFAKVAGKLPIRVKFLIEGEEEIGSPNLANLIRAHKDVLACDYVALSDTPKFDDQTPAITYGTKGMVYKEVIINGPKQDLHSGSFGGTLANPGNVLARLISSLHDEHGRVTIPGFYEDVVPISDRERENLESLPFDERTYRDGMGVPALWGEAGFTTLERRWARPTLDVNGLFGGFTGEGASTIVPSTMMGKMSMRIVPHQSPEKISALFDEAVGAAIPPGVACKINTYALASPYVCPLDSPGIAAAGEAISAGYGKAPVFIREGGTLPILPLFKEILGADSLMLGFCSPNCNAHGPNEFFALSDLYNGAKTAVHLYDRFSSM